MVNLDTVQNATTTLILKSCGKTKLYIARIALVLCMMNGTQNTWCQKTKYLWSQSITINTITVWIMVNPNRHENYYILNLIGYGLSKFNFDFVNTYGFKTKTAFYQYIVDIGIAQTKGTVQNRQDRFNGMNPNSTLKGWWQDGDRSDYKFRKDYIESFFGNLNVVDFVNVVKISIAQKLSSRGPDADSQRMTKDEDTAVASPLIYSTFKQMQETGVEAEFFFLNNYTSIDIFASAAINDVRLFGDGYDFQLTLPNAYYLAEVKGIRNTVGSVRFTQNEYCKAKEFSDNYALVVVSNLEYKPKMVSIVNPLEQISFLERSLKSEQVYYQSRNIVWD